MREVFISIICLCILPGMRGLELTLDVNTPTSSGSNSVCGVLKCKEGHTSDIDGSVSNISTIKIFKSTQPNSIEKGDILASLTQEQPSIARESDGVKFEGRLEARQATIQLEMTKKEDCYAQYTCEVKMVDVHRNEVVHINRLQQRQEEVRSQTVNVASASTGMALQLLVMLQQLDSKVALLGSTLDNKLGTLDTRLDYVKDRLEDKILSVRDDVESFKDAVDDKIEKRVVDQLCDLNIKLSTVAGAVKNAEEDNTNESEGCLATLRTELTQGQQNILSGTSAMTGKIDDLVNSTGMTLSAMKEDMSRVLACEQKDYDRFNSMLLVVKDIFNTSQDLSKQVETDFSLLNNNVQHFAQLSSKVVEKSENMLSSMRDFIAEADKSIISSLKNATEDIFNPKTCSKGMFSALPDAKFPYPVIRPSGESGLDVPYLCDTVTDGGGWIIIQRRATGNTDFYRDWDDYKKGFGTLDDDFWLGNDNIHALTSSAMYELRIELKYKGKASFAHYSSFSISDENNKYALSLGKYDGTAGDSLDHHRGRAFSTHDRDNDDHISHCAQVYTGAWWYGRCHNVNLNGQWRAGEGMGPRWRQLTDEEPVTFSEMKIRTVEQ